MIGYTGDTAWTDALIDVAAGADLLIAEAYYRDKAVPYHLRHADLVAHAGRLASRRIVLTHMSADMLDHLDQARFETAARRAGAARLRAAAVLTAARAGTAGGAASATARTSAAAGGP